MVRFYYFRTHSRVSDFFFLWNSRKISGKKARLWNSQQITWKHFLMSFMTHLWKEKDEKRREGVHKYPSSLCCSILFCVALQHTITKKKAYLFFNIIYYSEYNIFWKMKLLFWLAIFSVLVLSVFGQTRPPVFQDPEEIENREYLFFIYFFSSFLSILYFVVLMYNIPLFFFRSNTMKR